MFSLEKDLHRLPIPWPLPYAACCEGIGRFLWVPGEEAGDDPAFIAYALGNIARARGMAQLAQLMTIRRKPKATRSSEMFSRTLDLGRRKPKASAFVRT